MQETATLLEGAQLSANRFYCCGITDNPGRFDSKSTQVTRTLRRTDESRKEREKPGGEGRERDELVGIRERKRGRSGRLKAVRRQCATGFQNISVCVCVCVHYTAM